MGLTHAEGIEGQTGQGRGEEAVFPSAITGRGGRWAASSSFP